MNLGWKTVCRLDTASWICFQIIGSQDSEMDASNAEATSDKCGGIAFGSASFAARQIHDQTSADWPRPTPK